MSRNELYAIESGDGIMDADMRRAAYEMKKEVCRRGD